VLTSFFDNRQQSISGELLAKLCNFLFTFRWDSSAVGVLKFRFLAVRAISDTSEETLPPEVSRLSQPQSPMHRFGAALAAITRRPTAVTDLWKLWEQGMSCSRTLADRLQQIA